ncbi:acyl transferase domain-containing protein [Azospirillum agricola]|uniref:type I polyketide synthase n=1 Tax=Azospirillum agricola TaxID=1720247 RepID=UPI001AE51A7F|nr:type I polyketide synthase [Azospirillum agricola]MBP2231646.1 acyl transferase domain-containing protein [Azospirillum agricola]
MDSPLPSPSPTDPSQGDRVAIIGVAGRFPGADSVPAFWRMLERGESGLARGPADAHGLVRSCFALADKDCFDAAFFGFAPSEAALMDPQHRLFLETAWHAMEDAGYGGGDLPVTGVFAAAGFNDYVLRHVGPRSHAEGAAERFAMLIGNDKDFLASRAAHLLDLTGPASVAQSACSSGLLCVHQAVQSLLQGEVAMALAGAVSVSMDLEDGYRADPGGPMSPTGTIAPFSATADGIVGGNGVAALVLKRLDDALADRDHVYAVIEATAANNDGRDRASFTAPGVAGQARVLAEALGLSGRSADAVSYIEAHGTGTPIGDPIEVEAIKRVYGPGRTPCLIGSVKGNVGHLNTVAGLAGLLKAVLVVRGGRVPPTLNLAGVNPLLALDGTRFSVCDRPTALPGDGGRLAAVSSFGFGGTNVHVLLGPPPAAGSGADDRSPVLLGWSARTGDDRAALDRRLADAWAADARDAAPGRPLADDAGTLLHGRRRFAHRHAVVAADAGEAARRIEAGALIRPRRAGGEPGARPGPLVFLFPGQGAQFAGMGAPLHRGLPGFRDRIDRCATLLEPLLGRDLRGLLYGNDDAALVPTLHSQLALFATEYALAGTLADAGLRPAALLGHSVGEYVAACLAGVFSLEDALRLVHARGRLMAGLPPAGMLAVQAGPARLEPHLTAALSLAVVNRADRCVVAGAPDALDALAESLRRDGVASRRLAVSHGFHSHLMEPILDSFAAVCRTVAFDRPCLPVLSNADGGLADPDAIATPGHWVRHLRQTVRFADNVDTLRRRWPDATALELGPGSGCTAMIGRDGGLAALPTMVTRDSQTTDLLAALGQLWVDGHDMDPALPTLGRAWRRVPLPGYPFQRVRHLLPPLPERPAPSPDRVLPPDERFLVPQWRSLPHTPFATPAPAPAQRGRVGVEARPLLLFLPDHPFPIPQNADAIRVHPGPGYRENPDGSFHLRPGDAADFRRLAARLEQRAIRDALCLFGWLHGGSPANDRAADDRANGHDSLVRLAQTLLPAGIVGHLLLLTDRLAVIDGTETPRCEQALALGVLRAIPFELPGVQAGWLDADRLPDPATLARIDARRRADPALHALSLALRNGRLWERRLVPLSLPPEDEDAPHPIRPGGTYVVTGGTGGLGLELLRRLARQRCHLVAIARSIDAALRADPSRHPVLAECLAQGATLTLVAGSADDRSLLDGVAADLLRQGHPANGIFHLAGRYVPQTLQDRTLAERDTNHRAKLLGAQALLAAFAPHAPDFLVNFSSLAGETSGYGNADYMAANLALGFLAEAGTAPFPVVTIGWDNWEKLGALGRATAESGDGTLFLGRDERAIAAEDGFAALWRILRGSHAHALVSPTDIGQRLREVDHAARARQGRTAEPPDPAPGAAALPADGPPLERLTMLLFARTLGIDRLAPTDDFLQLGGDSIMAVRLLSRLRAILQAEFALPDFLANRTPAQLARRLDAIPGAATTALAYLHIQSLSEHDRRSLRRHAGPS